MDFGIVDMGLWGFFLTLKILTDLLISTWFIFVYTYIEGEFIIDLAQYKIFYTHASIRNLPEKQKPHQEFTTEN